MTRFARGRRHQQEDPDINMIPIMNMFMVLIPFLLMSASFFHIKAINTSVPVRTNLPAKQDIEKADTVKITVVLEIKEDKLRISALSDTVNDLSVSSLETIIPKTAGGNIAVTELVTHLKMMKAQYPDSDTMIMIPDDTISYQEIITTMDCARTFEAESLFPKVVLSGSLG